MRAEKYVHTRDNIIKVRINDKQKEIEKVTCKDVYWEYVKKIRMTPTAQSKWSKYVNTEDIVWKDHYVIPYVVCKETALQSFQYKILNRFYPCQYTLSLWYKDQQSNCIDCNDIDHLEHHFYECNHVYRFWTAVENWWKITLQMSIPLNAKHVLFGMPNPNEDKIIDVLNLCILYGKWYISECKKNNTQLFLPNYIRMVKGKLTTEKTLSCIQGDESFEKRWLDFYEQL